jgi:tRNA threonylcarbamoyladenosine biosynthesis protein TsaB
MTLHLLALETSSSVCGVALLSQLEGLAEVHAESHDATAEHAERLLPMVDAVLARAGIDAHELQGVAFGQGPGGFTGLRVACGVAQGMAFGLGLTVFPVDSLQAVAQRDYCNGSQAHPNALRVVLQDARMDEVYAGAYVRAEHGGWLTVHEPILMAHDAVEHWLMALRSAWPEYPQLYCLGDAFGAYPALRAMNQTVPGCLCGPSLRADATAVAQLGMVQLQRGQGVQPDLAAPLYVRDKVAFTTAERERGAGGNPRANEPAFLLPMTPAHLEQVAAIEQRVQSFPWTLRNFADGLQAGYGAWVVCRANTVLGFCMVMFAPDVAHVLVIAVHPDAQRQGYASRLLEHCEQQAVQRGLPAVLLEVRPSNKGALAFYEARGYTQLSVRKNYYPAAHGSREDACVMQKRL